jgi:hypothetical protein
LTPAALSGRPPAVVALAAALAVFMKAGCAVPYAELGGQSALLSEARGPMTRVPGAGARP